MQNDVTYVNSKNALDSITIYDALHILYYRHYRHYQTGRATYWVTNLRMQISIVGVGVGVLGFKLKSCHSSHQGLLR